MSICQLLARIDEVELMAQEANEVTREKYYDLLDKLNYDLEQKIRKQDYGN